MEGPAENCAVWSFGDWVKVKAVKRGEHGEFKLESVRGINCKRNKTIISILGEFDVEGLFLNLAFLEDRRHRYSTYNIVLHTIDTRVGIAQLCYTIVAR